jgi:hypothetical protein
VGRTIPEGSSTVSATTPATTTEAATPLVLPTQAAMAWLMGTTVLAMIVYYFIGVEQGATAVFSGAQVHELIHDARHFLGFPCH